MASVDYFLATQPILGHTKDECGDAGIIKKFDDKVFVAILDVAGHGSIANNLAHICINFLKENYSKPLIGTMRALHTHIKGSRGAVAALSLLDITSGELRYVGIGNITARRFGSIHQRLIPKDGIIGYIMPRPEEKIVKLQDGDIWMLYTDGIKEHFSLEDYPGLLQDDAKTITTQVINEFSKAQDDACCVVLKYKR